jgi:hypothetical protein
MTRRRRRVWLKSFAVARATLTNTTVDEHDPSIAYTGTWTTNNDTLFYGGSSIYTSTPGDSFSFNFSGTSP